MVAAVTDPTLTLFQELQHPDPDKWVCVENVPCFDEHAEYDDQGNLIANFGPAELQELADNCNRRFLESADACPITIGHTRDDASEEDQPEIVGYAKDFFVGHFGPKNKLGILAKFCYFASQFEKTKGYPRRSVERWVKEKVFDPIALLKRTPERDLGVLTYRRRDNGVVRIRYARDYGECSEPVSKHCKGDTMPDMPMPEHAAAPPVAAPPVAPPAAPPEEGHAAKYMKTFASDPHHHEVMRYMHHLFDAHKQAHDAHFGSGMPTGHSEHYAAGPGFAGPTNTFVPGGASPPHGHHHSPVHMSKDGKPVAGAPVDAETARMQQEQKEIEVARYQKQMEDALARVAALEADNTALKKKERVAKYERDLGHLISKGYQFDLAEEVKDCADLNEEQFEAHKARITKRYQRAPVSDRNGYIPTNVGPVETDPGKQATTREQMNAAVKYARENNVKFDDALTKVKANGKAV